MSEQVEYSWVDFHHELAQELSKYKNNQKELIEKSRNACIAADITVPDAFSGNEANRENIDPFTVFALLYKLNGTGGKVDRLMSAIKDEFGLIGPLPKTYNFAGKHTISDFQFKFFHFGSKHLEKDIQDLWNLFDAALTYKETPSEENLNVLKKEYDTCVKIMGISCGKLSRGLYWIAPETFLAIDDDYMNDAIYKSGYIPKEVVKSLPPLKKRMSAEDYFKYVDILKNYLSTKLDEPSIIEYTNKLNYEGAMYKTNQQPNKTVSSSTNAGSKQDLSKYVKALKTSMNIILRGAPGTGKTFMAKNIAAEIITGQPGKTFDELDETQKKQTTLVQFHPGYDYTDFVEGLRPVDESNKGQISFRLKAGSFKKFVNTARANYEDSQKTIQEIENRESAKSAIDAFIESTGLAENEKTELQTKSGKVFYIADADGDRIKIHNPKNEQFDNVWVSRLHIQQLVESGKDFKNVKEVADFFNISYQTQANSYEFAIYQKIQKLQKQKTTAKVKPAKLIKLKNYVFIIDEINRGDISKIFGELFFSIDPGYRGKAGEVETQFSNLHNNGVGDDDKYDKFYIPENVYIIGTMNDIDRSVDTFDFAMRRRFRFMEVPADSEHSMLKGIKDEKKVRTSMQALNEEIVKVQELGKNYQIGPAYFLKLEELSYDELWNDCLEPLLSDYVAGLPEPDKKLETFKTAFFGVWTKNGESNEDSQG